MMSKTHNNMSPPTCMFCTELYT